ncbi:archaea-specific SMC-related protein [Natrialbaceae archaeon A-chndr2]
MTKTQAEIRHGATALVENVGGIEHAEVALNPGLTTLAGANATNRTSLLCAINEALGGTMGTVRRGANDEGYVELTVGDKTYTRTLDENNGMIYRHGNPYLKDSVVDFFASLLEENPLRRLVATADKDEIDERLAELLMAPIDIDAIQADIESRQECKDDVEKRLGEISAAKAEVPDLTEQQRELRERIESITESLSAKRSRLLEVDDDDNGTSLFDELRDAREQRRECERTLKEEETHVESIQESLSDTREELAEVRAEIEATTQPDSATIDDLSERALQVDHVAAALSELDHACDVLRPVPDSDDTASESVLSDEFRVDGDDVTTPRDADEERTECPACGLFVDRDALTNRRGRLRSLAAEYREEADRLEEKRDDLRSQRFELEEMRDRRRELENELARLEEDLEDRERTIETLKAEREDLQATIEDLEDRVERAKERRDREVRQLYDDVADLQMELAAAEAELGRVETALAEHEEIIEDEPELRDEKRSLEEAIREQRERVNDRETRVQRAVSKHASNLLDRLEYDRLADIRIERHPSDDPHLLSAFELVIERRVDGDVIEERDVTTLSGSERALVGLVVALAGYVAHDVADDVPFLLLDAIEQFDGDRIDRLLTYVRDELAVDYVVVALLPEDADALRAECNQIDAEAFDP